MNAMEQGERVSVALTHIVSHLLREVDSGVREVLTASLVNGARGISLQPPEPLEPGRHVTPNSAADGEAGPSVSRTRDQEVDDDSLGESHAKSVASILGALGMPDNSPQFRQWRALGRTLHRLAHRNGLNAARPVDASFQELIDGTTRLFDEVLDRFEGRYGEVYSRLDVLLSVPTPKKADVSSIPNTPHTLAYFFDRLDHAGWLDRLANAGHFNAEPSRLGHAHAASQVPRWAALDYLKRMAQKAPARVTDILGTVPESVDPRVCAQVIDILLALRPGDRLAALPRVRRSMPVLSRYYFGDHGPKFALQLVEDGALDEAFAMSAVLLETTSPDGARTPQHVAGYAREQERAWHLRESGGPLFTSLLRQDAVRTIRLLAVAVDHHAGRRTEDASAPADVPQGLDDYSSLWARDLSTDAGREVSDLRVFLAHSLRRALLRVGTESPDALAGVVAVMRESGARVLRRIEFVVLATLIRSDNRAVSTAATSVAAACLTTPAILHDHDVDVEVASLLSAYMAVATVEQRQQVLDATNAPPFAWMDDAEAAAKLGMRWRRDRLALVSEYLPARERGELAALVASVGNAVAIARSGPSVASWSVPPSPLDDTTLRAMSEAELIGFLDTWRTVAKDEAPSREGLAARIRAMVAADAPRYAEWAPRFVGRHPHYIEALLNGLLEATRRDVMFAWYAPLELLLWVAEQPVSAADVDEAVMTEIDASSAPHADLGLAKRAVADLVGHGLGRSWNAAGSLPWDEQTRIWRIVSALAEDPNPSPAYEEKWGGTNMDPSQLAINTVRPQAIDAAIRFAFWSAQHRLGAVGPLVDVLVSERAVAELLERHLQPAVDSSPAVRAAIGRWLTPLARTDPDWVRTHLTAMLTASGDASVHAVQLRDAVWDSFVRWSQPHPDALPVLEGSYRSAVARIGHTRRIRDADEPDDSLAEHLVALYWWGGIALDEPGNLAPNYSRMATCAAACTCSST